MAASMGRRRGRSPWLELLGRAEGRPRCTWWRKEAPIGLEDEEWLFMQPNWGLEATTTRAALGDLQASRGS